LIPNELVLTFVSYYICASFGENRSRNATVRVYTDTNWFCDLCYAWGIFYSNGADNEKWVKLLT